MDHTENNMSSSRSEPSHSPPSSPPLSSVIPTPPPPPPLPLPAPPQQNIEDQTPPPNYLTVFHGNLTSFLRSSFRQKKWALVLILPRASSFSVPSSPTLPPSPRPAWGPGARHQANRLEAPEEITDNVILWRRTIGSSDAENYKAFFPVDGHPHFALLDPRSGERLLVWGNTDGENMAAPTKVDELLWSQILSDLKDFIQNHSLENDALGPAHYQEKSWAVRTRRVSEKSGLPDANLPSTSVMDDEEAAIAAAIAASLQQSNPPSGEQEENDDNTLSDDYSLDGDESSELFTSDDMSDNGDSADDTTQEDVSARSDISNENVEEDHDMGVSIRDEHHTRSQPIPIPSRGQEPTPSSVESVSLSYIERMESCLRSRTDPNLMASRKLIEQQNAELARSLEEDKRRERLEMEIATKQAMEKEQKISAAARLPDEPAEGASHAVSIALRLPGGARLVRRFNNFDGLKSIADFVIAEVGYTQVLAKSPQEALRIPGGKLSTHDWNVDIGSLGLGKRAMFVVHID